MHPEDRSFINNFMLVIGFLVACGVMFYVTAHILASENQAPLSADPLKQQQIATRLEPVADAYVGSVPANANPSPAPSGKAQTAAGAPQSGKQIWQGTCSACHGTGIAGAPKIGDKQQWAPHLAKGLKTLEDHALHGFTGKAGTMPAKGGNPSLTDAQVIKAMKYMIGQSGGAAMVKKAGG